MKILIAYDGSPSAEYAVDEVARRPWPAGSAVRIVTVLEKIRLTQRQSMQEGLEKAGARFKARADLKVDWELREGAVNRTLLDSIRGFSADLVVAGSHGATALERLFLGSVSHALVTHAPCSVEIVKKPHHEG